MPWHKRKTRCTTCPCRRTRMAGVRGSPLPRPHNGKWRGVARSLTVVANRFSLFWCVHHAPHGSACSALGSGGYELCCESQPSDSTHMYHQARCKCVQVLTPDRHAGMLLLHHVARHQAGSRNAARPPLCYDGVHSFCGHHPHMHDPSALAAPLTTSSS